MRPLQSAEVLLEAFSLLSETERIIPALESAQAVAQPIKIAPALPRDAAVVINLSSRGDKDVAEVARIAAPKLRRQ